MASLKWLIGDLLIKTRERKLLRSMKNYLGCAQRSDLCVFPRELHSNLGPTRASAATWVISRRGKTGVKLEEFRR